MTTFICHTCRSKAVIRMRQHRLAFCKEHYLEWFTAQTERSIQKYGMFPRTARVLVAVSGGKDSLSLWDVLWRCGYETEGFYIHLGIHGLEDETDYSAQSAQYVRQFAQERNLKLHVVDVKKEYGKSIPELSRFSPKGKTKPCATCGLVKRHIMNQIALDLHNDVVVTGHNLDDEVAVLFGNTMNWQQEMLVRQSPVLAEYHGLARKAKPFCRFTEREVAAYALLRQIAYIYEECPFSRGSTTLYYKSILNQIEDSHPGSKLRFYSSFLKAREGGFFNSPEQDHPSQSFPAQLCPSCKQPTTRSGLCSFCSLITSQNPRKKIP